MKALQQLGEDIDTIFRFLFAPLRWLVSYWDQLQTEHSLYGTNLLRVIGKGIEHFFLSPWYFCRRYQREIREVFKGLAWVVMLILGIFYGLLVAINDRQAS